MSLVLLKMTSKGHWPRSDEFLTEHTTQEISEILTESLSRDVNKAYPRGGNATKLWYVEKFILLTINRTSRLHLSYY